MTFGVLVGGVEGFPLWALDTWSNHLKGLQHESLDIHFEENQGQSLSAVGAAGLLRELVLFHLNVVKNDLNHVLL